MFQQLFLSDASKLASKARQAILALRAEKERDWDGGETVRST